jgi:hypothetical protein
MKVNVPANWQTKASFWERCQFMSKLGFPSEDALAYNDGCCCMGIFIAR